MKKNCKGELKKLKVKSFTIIPRFILNLNNYDSNGSKKKKKKKNPSKLLLDLS